ncbi:hypothetical protein PVNG_02134 [Plasmodium vivax North Korean]|uniref:PIR Superfamily Protein n=1 Tax=Plasmodium vivax North Korean TaxID=1035514 RepID=A0A0J9TV52_PLAVI|nr:hypothetical protein PVNG_02134 [Plasmodium vivax North Korean]
MPDGTLDIAKLNNDYPFLKEIWKSYTFEEDPIETGDNVELFSICDEYSMYENNPTEDQKKACRKLLKNWKLLRSTIKRTDVFFEWCNNINNWIYYEIKPNILNVDIINRILIKAQEKIFMHIPNKNYCTYTILNKKHEPQALNKLRIFSENTSKFKNILLDKSSNNYCSCINFVNDCIYIYRILQSKLCSKEIDKSINNKDTCDIVNTFNINYTGFLLNKYIGVQGILPDLYSTNDININIDNCPLQTKGKELNSFHGDQLDSYTSSTTPTEPAGKTVSTAIGTIFGVSSVLGLLYKVISNFYLNM